MEVIPPSNSLMVIFSVVVGAYVPCWGEKMMSFAMESGGVST